MRYIVTARRESKVVELDADGYCRECRTKHGPWGHGRDVSVVSKQFSSMDMAVVWSQFMRRAGYETEEITDA